jgi:hypothetical protein
MTRRTSWIIATAAIEENEMQRKRPFCFATPLMALLAAGIVLVLAPHRAEAIPSFARQTGMACAACHTVFPELTPFGRRFKLSGYVLTTKQEITAVDETKKATLSMPDLPPVSIMFQGSATWLGKATDDTGSGLTPPTAPAGAKARNGTVEFPQTLSLFYGGKISGHAGAFFQISYTQPDNHFSIDNSDIRYADLTESGDLLYGVTLNNNITVQDVWNGTPAWGYPAFVPPVGVTPAAGPLIGALGASVAGVGVYGFYKDALYLEASVYRASLTGATVPIDSTSGAYLDNVAPYARVAYEWQSERSSLQVGVFGARMQLNSNPAGAPVAPDTYTDVAVDAQYQFIGEQHIFSVAGSWIHENQSLDGLYAAGSATNTTNSLNQIKVTGSYYYKRMLGGQLTLGSVTGTTDAALYAASTTGSPDSRWATVEVDYLPFLNTKVMLQYTAYQKFNGSSGVYDGVRKAADNNALMLGLWTSF